MKRLISLLLGLVLVMGISSMVLAKEEKKTYFEIGLNYEIMHGEFGEIEKTHLAIGLFLDRENWVSLEIPFDVGENYSSYGLALDLRLTESKKFVWQLFRFDLVKDGRIKEYSEKYNIPLDGFGKYGIGYKIGTALKIRPYQHFWFIFNLGASGFSTEKIDIETKIPGSTYKAYYIPRDNQWYQGSCVNNPIFFFTGISIVYRF